MYDILIWPAFTFTQFTLSHCLNIPGKGRIYITKNDNYCMAAATPPNTSIKFVASVLALL